MYRKYVLQCTTIYIPPKDRRTESQETDMPTRTVHQTELEFGTVATYWEIDRWIIVRGYRSSQQVLVIPLITQKQLIE